MSSYNTTPFPESSMIAETKMPTHPEESSMMSVPQTKLPVKTNPSVRLPSINGLFFGLLPPHLLNLCYSDSASGRQRASVVSQIARLATERPESLEALSTSKLSGRSDC